VEVPEVRYAKSGDVKIAYSVAGSGPFDLVFVNGWVLSALDQAWEGPPGDFFRCLARFSRLIVFDKRGTGYSDRAAGIPDLETRMDDIRAVMDAAGSKRAGIMGFSEGGPMSMLFAATYPERTAAAVFYGTRASYIHTDAYPWGFTAAEAAESIRDEEESAGTQPWLEEWLGAFAPSWAEDEEKQRWWRRYVLASTSPSAAAALRRMNMEIDASPALSAIRAPALVIVRAGDGNFVDQGRYVAAHLPGAQLVELPGSDHAYFVDPEDIAGEVERFLTTVWSRGDWDLVESNRMLTTVMFTDIVGSTATLVEVGDRRWQELLEQHHVLVRGRLARFSGREIDTAGDGFFACFDGPARAIRCACEITAAVPQLGIDVRAGVHTGECEIVDGKIRGIAVHIGARIAGEAGAGEVVVSSTVKDLVAGSGLRFRERGTVTLKGLPDPWRLYAVEPETADFAT
jgi:class 3 adenylate cyclase